MPYFADAAEVYRYIGGAFRLAADHPEAGPRLRAVGATLRIEYRDPAATLTLRLRAEGVEIIEGQSDLPADIHLSMTADNGNRFWRGEYNAALGLAKGEARARGPIAKILKVLPAAKPVFPLYRELIAAKEQAGETK
ncbi:SCP2 sterol-binding domain-containing protein [Streptomyces sp. NPDC050161]|uniref:SCP2 sterol-binding domain-containing protein n=1 Tax=Streptomyces sp. NPDC050161 TaxID=3365604 RepID=UPI0037A3505C